MKIINSKQEANVSLSKNKNQKLTIKSINQTLKELYNLKNKLNAASVVNLTQLSQLTKGVFDSFLVVITIQYGYNQNEKDNTNVVIPLDVKSLAEFKNKKPDNELQSKLLEEQNIKPEYAMTLIQIQNLAIDIILELNKKKITLQTLNSTIKSEDVIKICLTDALEHRLGDYIEFKEITNSNTEHKE
jgi:hypothetical protein